MQPTIILLLGTTAYILFMLVFALIFAGGLYLAFSGPGQGRIDQTRRSFLAGRSGGASDALFFGIQIVIQVFGSDELRARLAARMDAEDATDSAEEKRKFLKSIAAILTENRYAWEYGFWDYYDENETSIATFNEWRNEIEASMATEPDEMGDQADKSQRFSDRKEYLIVTLMMLIDNREETIEDDAGDIRFRPTYAQLAQPFVRLIEDFEEEDYWKPATFEKLLYALRSLDPRVIERDGIYVYPGTSQDGLSSLDLLGDEGWQYITEHSLR